MKVEKFFEAVEALTGTELKQVGDRERDGLRELLGDDKARIDCSQFNELLLLVNKDRVELPFFRFFFTEHCRVRDIRAGVDRFRKTAMLRYGNFVWAFRTLSRIKDDGPFLQELGEWALEAQSEIKKFTGRRSKLLEIRSIGREHTVFLGYLSSFDLAADEERCTFLRRVANSLGPAATLDSFKSAISRAAQPKAQTDLRGIVDKFARIKKTKTISEFRRFLNESARAIDESRRRFKASCSQGERNQEIYLTWDHMDVYFATSMRKPWEFHALYDFIQQLMCTRRLQKLKLRYFDPTQSYTPTRINKGLLESLMLKRAKCTVYSVQDTDTLGKDSELAATLAQGKPVIAYVPEVDVQARTRQLVREEPAIIRERLKFVLYADESFGSSVSEADYEFVRSFEDEQLSDSRVWRSVPDAKATKDVRKRVAGKIARLCRIIAAAEKRIYDGRANTLLEFHPLAIQVNLDTGVANGVLVVRNIEQCSKLLRNILTKAMEFELAEDKNFWYLRERISGSVHRVVTKDLKLSNCFWNFYLR